jgi:hypothetical protein
MRQAILLILVLAATSARATPTGACEASAPRTTPHGAVSRVECGNVQVGGRSATILIDGVAVLSSKELYKEDSDDALGYFVYSREADPGTGCPDRLFKVTAFGVQGACNQFESVRWSAKASTVTLKKGVRFIVENGTVIAPKAGPALWKAIEPPHAGDGLSQEAAQPFVQDVDLPPPSAGSAR